MSGIRAPGDLAAFFEPRSVAVVGASRDPTKVGGSVVANLRAAGFEGRIWPVNPRGDVVQGLPATASLLAIDGPVDLAVIAVPAPAVLPTLKEWTPGRPSTAPRSPALPLAHILRISRCSLRHGQSSD